MVKSSKTVLVVEDHEDSAGSLARLLRIWGYLPQVAGSLAQARALALATRFDLMVCDLGLPDGDGCDLMRELFREYNIKGIALTGYGQPDDIQRATDAGFVAHVLKPVEVVRLQAVVEQVASSPPKPADTSGHA
jgi:CheY-like chemotaxis protein